MDPRGSAIVDFIEAAYDLRTKPDDWLSALIRAGVPMLDTRLLWPLSRPGARSTLPGGADLAIPIQPFYRCDRNAVGQKW